METPAHGYLSEGQVVAPHFFVALDGIGGIEFFNNF